MSKILIYFFAILLLLSFNTVMPSFQQAIPNFLFLFVLFLAFRKDSPDFLWVAFFAGIFLDVFSAPIFGTYLFSFLLLGIIVNTTTRTFFSADPNALYVGTVIVVSNLILIGLIYLINGLAYQFHNISQPLAPVYLSQKIWLDLVLNLLFALPLYLFTYFVEKLVLHFQHKESYV